MDNDQLDKLPKHRKEWLEVFGNQWAATKTMPGTCEACVWGTGKHAEGCEHKTVVMLRSQLEKNANRYGRFQ
jgi:hypothetical protein